MEREESGGLPAGLSFSQKGHWLSVPEASFKVLAPTQKSLSPCCQLAVCPAKAATYFNSRACAFLRGRTSISNNFPHHLSPCLVKRLPLGFCAFHNSVIRGRMIPASKSSPLYFQLQSFVDHRGINIHFEDKCASLFFSPYRFDCSQEK